MKNRMKRRDFLRYGLAGIAAGGASTAFGPRVLAWGPACSNEGAQAGVRKMLLVFLRGGWDGVNVAIPCGVNAQSPVGGSVYDEYKDLRPSIHIKAWEDMDGTPDAERAQRLQSMTGAFHPFCQLHPALAPLTQIYNDGKLAILHRIGYDDPSLSHFSAEHFFETADPQDFVNLRGWVTRWATKVPSGFVAGSVSSKIQRLFDTDVSSEVLPHIVRLIGNGFSTSSYSLADLDSSNDAYEAHLKQGLADAFESVASGDPPIVSDMDLRTREIGKKMLESTDQVDMADLISSPYSPQAGVTYPTQGSGDPVLPTDLPDGSFVDTFGQQLLDAAALLKCTTARIVGVQWGGWDTHSDQGAQLGSQQERLAVLGAGLRAIYDDFTLDADAPDLLTLAMSEFGRTTKENDSNGTDHGRSGLMLAVGGDLNTDKQVHNCSDDAGEIDPWVPGTLTDYGNDKHMVHRTDFRSVLDEALVKHMQLDPGDIDDVLENFAMLRADNPTDPQYESLDFLNPAP